MHDSGRWNGHWIAWSSSLNLNPEKSIILQLYTKSIFSFIFYENVNTVISSQILHTVHRLQTTNFPPALFAARAEYIGKLKWKYKLHFNVSQKKGGEILLSTASLCVSTYCQGCLIYILDKCCWRCVQIKSADSVFCLLSSPRVYLFDQKLSKKK